MSIFGIKIKIILFITLGFCYTIHSTAQECNIIYVTPTGASSGVAGTITNPANLTYGLTLVNSTNNIVWISTGIYLISNTLLIPSNVTLEGGFNPPTWVKSTVSQTLIERNASNFLAAPANALIALLGNAVSNFRLQDLTITTANAPSNQISVYGIYLTGCSNYNITRCNISTGAASAGLNGTPGNIGGMGTNGANGLAASYDSTTPAGGAGGIGNSSNDGGNGGAGARHSPNGTEIGLAGLPAGCGGAGGNGGDGPDCGCGLFGTSNNSSCSGSSPLSGAIGGLGLPGNIGGAGAAGSIITGYWVPGGLGLSGTAGLAGCGGGGGGGGAGRQQNGPDEVGGSGGGGGAGGEGGSSGTGGSGGGSTYAVFSTSNGASGVIEDCFLNPGAAGPGGLGGQGGAGGVGGAGGTGGTGFGCPMSVGANGGNGGLGGQGGAGGDGAIGESLALSENGGTPISNLGITVVPGTPPDISYTSKGCTNSEVIFNSLTSGTWNFGVGASPATANGTGPFSVYYSSMGIKDIVFDGTTFSDFITIFQAGPVIPSITPANGNVILGCPNTFSTSITGTYYTWVFGNTANPDTLEGAAMQTVNNIYFLAPGVVTINVYITTTCCGIVRDITDVTVTPSASDVALISLSANSCVGDPITFTAAPNTYLGYDFIVNGNSVQSGLLNTFTTSALNPGDSLLVIAIAGACLTNPSDVLLPVITPLPVVTLINSDTDSTICEGESVLFIATPIGFTSYEFFDGLTSIQNSTSISFSSSTLLPGNSITVVATNLGCTGLASNASVTTVNLAPQIVLTSSDADNLLCGTGQSITFTASPPGFTNYDFLNSGSNIQSGASNTYTTTALTNGSMIEVIATSSSGCIGQTSNAITTSVNPIPGSWLGSSDLDNIICENELITFNSIPSGYDNYEFFNAGISVQSGANNTFNTTLIAGNSITVIATDLGCPSALSNALTITVIPADAVDGGIDFSACINAGNIVLIGATPTNGLWNGTGITDPIGLFSPATAGVGIHKLIYSFINTSSCVGYDTIFASVNPLPVVSVTPANPEVCEGYSLAINGAGANTYVWLPPSSGLSSSTGAVVNASPITTTTYTLVGTSNNCVDSTIFSITVNPVPLVSISGITTIGSCENTVLTALPSINNGTLSWGPLVNLVCNTCESATVSPTSAQNYYVTLTSPDGCYDTDTVTINILNIYNYFMPTGFSPNGDGINDSLHVHGRGIESVNLMIFDRTGQKVFETTDYKLGWGGKFNELEMNDGVFVFTLEVKYCNGELINENGTLSLIR